MRAFDRAVPGRQILDGCSAAATLSSCSYANVSARVATAKNRYDKTTRKNRTDAIQTQKQLATVGHRGVLYGGRGGYRRCCNENEEYKAAQAALGRRPDWVEFMLPANFPAVEASPDAPGPRFFVTDRADPTEIVRSLCTHVSRSWPPGSREPFLLSRAGLQTDQEGFGFDEAELAITGARSLARETARAGLNEEEAL